MWVIDGRFRSWEPEFLAPAAGGQAKELAWGLDLRKKLAGMSPRAKNLYIDTPGVYNLGLDTALLPGGFDIVGPGRGQVVLKTEHADGLGSDASKNIWGGVSCGFECSDKTALAGVTILQANPPGNDPCTIGFACTNSNAPGTAGHCSFRLYDVDLIGKNFPVLLWSGPQNKVRVDHSRVNGIHWLFSNCQGGGAAYSGTVEVYDSILTIDPTTVFDYSQPLSGPAFVLDGHVFASYGGLCHSERNTIKCIAPPAGLTSKLRLFWQNPAQDKHAPRFNCYDTFSYLQSFTPTDDVADIEALEICQPGGYTTVDIRGGWGSGPKGEFTRSTTLTGISG